MPHKEKKKKSVLQRIGEAMSRARSALGGGSPSQINTGRKKPFTNAQKRAMREAIAKKAKR